MVVTLVVDISGTYVKQFAATATRVVLVIFFFCILLYTNITDRNEERYFIILIESKRTRGERYHDLLQKLDKISSFIPPCCVDFYLRDVFCV